MTHTAFTCAHTACAHGSVMTLYRFFLQIALQTVGALAGRLGAVETATHNSMLMIFFWLTAPLYGVGVSTQQRMGFHLGAGRPGAARLSGILCVGVDMSLGLIVAALMVGLRHYLGCVFSSSRAVVDMVAAIAPLVAGAYCVVGLFYSSMATLGGQGRPLPVALAFFLGAFLVAPSAGYYLTFVIGCCGRVKLYGLWLGLIAGYTLTTVISGVAICKSDWHALSKQAQERSEVMPQPAGGEVDGCNGGRTAPCIAADTCDACQPVPQDGTLVLPAQAGSRHGMGAPLLQNAAPPGGEAPQQRHGRIATEDAENWDLAD